MSDSKKLVITGANGYLGQHTIKRAIQNGWNVIGIVRREDAAKEVESLGAKAVIIKEFNIESIKGALKGCKALIHFRGVVCGSKEIFEKINVLGIKTIIEASQKMKVSRIIFPSGLGVDKYGKIDWANNEYFRTKWAAEQIIRESKIPYVIFRPSYILGPGDELIPDMIEQIGAGTVSIAGDGKIPMQPIFVNDATKAFIAAAENVGEDNQIYNLVGPDIINMCQLIDKVFKEMVSIGFNIPPPKIEHIPYEEAPRELGICKEMIDVMRCDIISDGNKTANILGFNLSKINKAIKTAVAAKLIPKEKKKGKKAIILLSGGIDSATALFWAHKEGYELYAISFNYYFRPEKEKLASKRLGESLQAKVIEVPIEYLKETIDLRIEGFPAPSAIHAPEGFIPTRNLVFYSIAAYYAEVYGCNAIIGGHILDDTSSFSDANSQFFNSLEYLINKGKHLKDKSTIELIFPLISMEKKDVIKLAKKLNVPFEWTWSCYYDGDKPCGKCSCCSKRAEAFSNLGWGDKRFEL
ncbi:MAG: 7-cyano-7-deazaguanine synthase [Promethearchaeota archaeon]